VFQISFYHYQRRAANNLWRARLSFLFSTPVFVLLVGGIDRVSSALCLQMDDSF
jgi:hypothetical protein